jgi:hypothetical protein
MGHKISGDIESHYIIPPEAEQRKLYEAAYKNLDTSTSRSIETRLKAIEEVRAKIPEEVKKIMDAYGLQFRQSSKNSKFEKIEESQLLEKLRDGWNIVQKLSNGSFIVERS